MEGGGGCSRDARVNVSVSAMPGCSPNSWPRTGSRRRAQGVNQGTVGDSCGKRVARGSARSSMTLGGLFEGCEGQCEAAGRRRAYKMRPDGVER